MPPARTRSKVSSAMRASIEHPELVCKLHGACHDVQMSELAEPRLAGDRLSDSVYTELSEAIRSLELPPGTKLSEPTLAARLGVSRVPVREAIARLADQRLVTVTPQVGTRVAPILVGEVESACFIRSSLEAGAPRRGVAPRHRGGALHLRGTPGLLRAEPRVLGTGGTR